MFGKLFYFFVFLVRLNKKQYMHIYTYIINNHKVENSTVKNIIMNHLRYTTYNNTNQIDIQKIVRYNKYRKLYLLKIGGNFMLAVNYTNLRENMKSYMDKVTDDYETMIVTRKDNKNVVMISEETYNNMLENMHVMGNKSNYDWLMESKAQLEKGKCAMHNLLEDSVNE